MKRIYSFMFAAVAAFAAASCAQELDNQVPAGEAKVYTASVDGTETKAVLDGKYTNWENNDAILLYDGAAAAKYVTALEEPAAHADFALAENETALNGNKVIAVYPEWADGYKSSVADIENKTLSKAYLASNQNAKVGSYDPNTAIAMAYAEDSHLEFKNATALLKFTVANEGVKNVTVYSIGGEKLTGEWALAYNDGEPKATPAEGDASAGWVELSAGEGVFEVGEEYYISVYPQTLANGFGLEFAFDGVEGKHLVKKYESSVEFERNVILNLGELEFTGSLEPEKPAVSDWGIVGTMTSWSSNIAMEVDGDWYVAKNVSITTEDGFKFRNGNSWEDKDLLTYNAGKADVDVEYTLTGGAGEGNEIKVAASAVYDVYLALDLKKFKLEKVSDIDEPEQPGDATPGEASPWSVVGTFNSWGEQPDADMVTTTVENLFVAKDVQLDAYASFKVRKDKEWNEDYGGVIVYMNPGSWIDVTEGGSDISNTASGTFDIYFDYAGKKIYLVEAGADYTSANHQTVEGEEPKQEEPEVTEKMLYLKPNSNWTQSNARFAAYFWNDSGNVWVSMTDSDKDGIYEVYLPDGYDYGCNIIFCRMNPSTSANNWNNKWNQTADLIAPTDGKNLYTVKAGTWDNGDGTWSVK